MVYHWGGCIVSLTSFANVKVLLWLAFIRSGWNSSPSTKSQLSKMELVADHPPSFHNSLALSKYLTSGPQHFSLWSRYSITSQGCGEDSMRWCASRTQGSPWHAEGAVQENNQHESGPTLWPPPKAGRGRCTTWPFSTCSPCAYWTELAWWLRTRAFILNCTWIIPTPTAALAPTHIQVSGLHSRGSREAHRWGWRSHSAKVRTINIPPLPVKDVSRQLLSKYKINQARIWTRDSFSLLSFPLMPPNQAI